MQTSYICSYVHYIKHWEVLQEHSGSFIGRDGTFGEVVWKGSVGVHDSGGTPRKKASVWHPMALGSGAAPGARHTAARRTPSLAVRRRLRRAHQDTDYGRARWTSALPEPRQPSGGCGQARRDPRGRPGAAWGAPIHIKLSFRERLSN